MMSFSQRQGRKSYRAPVGLRPRYQIDCWDARPPIIAWVRPGIFSPSVPVDLPPAALFCCRPASKKFKNTDRLQTSWLTAEPGLVLGVPAVASTRVYPIILRTCNYGADDRRSSAYDYYVQNDESITMRSSFNVINHCKLNTTINKRETSRYKKEKNKTKQRRDMDQGINRTKHSNSFLVVNYTVVYSCKQHVTPR